MHEDTERDVSLVRWFARELMSTIPYLYAKELGDDAVIVILSSSSIA